MTKAIILAAGEGTRLRPYTRECPKCMVKVAGRSLLDYQLEVLQSGRIESIVIVKGYLADKLDRPKLKTYMNKRYHETNMVWSLFCAESELTGEVIVSYGDIAYSRDVLHKLIQSSHDIAVVIDREWESYWRERFIDPLDDAESLKIDDYGRISDIGQPPGQLGNIQGQYIGLMKFSGKGITILREMFDQGIRTGRINGKSPEKAYMTDMLQMIIQSGYDIYPVFVNGGWVEIDTVNDLNLPIVQGRLANISKNSAQ